MKDVLCASAQVALISVDLLRQANSSHQLFWDVLDLPPNPVTVVINKDYVLNM